ncbi:MAG: hypothetical protein ACK6BG_02940 [Cyanobacteriota bacterium]
MLEAYLDLESIAELAGGASDTRYRQRLQQAAADPRQLLLNWWLPHQKAQANLRDKAAQGTRADALEGELGPLSTALDAENAKVLRLEPDLTGTPGERAEMATVADLQDQRSAQNESLRQALVGEQQLRARSESLMVENDHLREKARVLLAQQHHLQEELEKTVLQAQAENQLMAAQYHQLLRAQSLMSRLLVQTIRERRADPIHRYRSVVRAADPCTVGS